MKMRITLVGENTLLQGSIDSVQLTDLTRAVEPLDWVVIASVEEDTEV